jgi:hypothetical protein
MLRKASQCASALLKRAGGGAGAKGGRAKATAGNADSGTPYAVAYITVSGQGEGRRIAGEIVQAQLAACVNLVPYALLSNRQALRSCYSANARAVYF